MKIKLTLFAVVLAFVQPGLASVTQAQGGGGLRGGAEIVGLHQGGAAAAAKIRQGDWIIGIDGNDCRNADDVKKLIKNQKDVDITVARRAGKDQHGRPLFRLLTFDSVRLKDGKLGVNIRSGKIQLRLK